MQRFEKLFKEQKFQEFINDYLEIEDKIVDKDKETLQIPLALSYFQVGDYEKASKMFGILADITNDPVLWFNCATSSILNKEVDKGLKAFENAKSTYLQLSDELKSQTLPVPHMMLYIASALADVEEYDKAFYPLHELACIYGEVKVTDDQFLDMRGVPFFSHFLQIVERIVMKQVAAKPGEWFDGLIERVDEDGAKKLSELKNKLIS